MAPLPHLAYKNASLKPAGEFGLFEHSLPQTPCLVPCSKRCTFLYQKLGSVDWLCCAWVSGPKFGSVKFFSVVSESFNSHIVGFSVSPNSLCSPFFFFPFCFWFYHFPQDHSACARAHILCSVVGGRIVRAGEQTSCRSQMISWRMFRKFPGFLPGMTLCSAYATPTEQRHKRWAVQNHYSRGLQTSFTVYF